MPGNPVYGNGRGRFPAPSYEEQREAMLRMDKPEHEDWREDLSSTLYIRFTRGPDYEDAFLCLNDGEPDMHDLAKMSFTQARLLQAAYKAGLPNPSGSSSRS